MDLLLAISSRNRCNSWINASDREKVNPDQLFKNTHKDTPEKGIGTSPEVLYAIACCGLGKSIARP